MATSAAVTTFKRVYADPTQQRESFAATTGSYSYLWAYYIGSVFDDLTTWQQYKRDNRLYRYIRSIYNPARRLVDFYAGAVYPGILTLSADAQHMPANLQQAIPLGDDTAQELKDALGQLWQWWNWQANKALMVRYGAALGDCLVELIDEPASGKVLASVTWPGWVDDLVLDLQGNVKGYSLAYQATDAEGKPYEFRKEVDGDSLRTYRNGELQGQSANPYGFVPAVWVKHCDLGGDHGAPALRNIGKWDELNSLAAHVHDRLHVKLSAPVMITGDGSITNLYDTAKKADSATQESSRAYGSISTAENEVLKLLHGPTGGDVVTIDMDVTDSLVYMQQLIAEIEQDHPELTMYSKLREMATVSGPAAQRLMGDVSTLVAEAQAQYDMQSVKLFQMAVAIAGWRAGNGDWGDLTTAQAKFLPFDLDSYARGDLDLTIQPRPLVPTNAYDVLPMWQAFTQATASGEIPPETALREIMGWTKEQIDVWRQEQQRYAEIQEDEFEARQEALSDGTEQTGFAARQPAQVPAGD